MPTRLLYLDDSRRTEADATIVRVHDDGGETTVVLDETIFYPQGGGQPTDRGRLTTARGGLDVRRVAFVNGEVLHIGPAEGVLDAGQTVRLSVDPEVRRQHALLHTGGHLVMTAVDRLVGYHPTKGYHFPNGPYVEFGSALPVEERASFAAKVQDVMDGMVAEDSEVTSYFCSRTGSAPTASTCRPRSRRANRPAWSSRPGTGRRAGTHVRRLGELASLQGQERQGEVRAYASQLHGRLRWGHGPASWGRPAPAAHRGLADCHQRLVELMRMVGIQRQEVAAADGSTAVRTVLAPGPDQSRAARAVLLPATWRRSGSSSPSCGGWTPRRRSGSRARPRTSAAISCCGARAVTSLRRVEGAVRAGVGRSR